jgi:hypothetical protein
MKSPPKNTFWILGTAFAAFWHNHGLFVFWPWVEFVVLCCLGKWPDSFFKSFVVFSVCVSLFYVIDTSACKIFLQCGQRNKCTIAYRTRQNSDILRRQGSWFVALGEPFLFTKTICVERRVKVGRSEI